jgi:CheY-like chemotaxis protein
MQGFVGAEDGLDAVRTLKEGGFDLIFTDVVFPGSMSGLEIAEKAVRLHPNIKVICTTGYAESAAGPTTGLNSELNLVKKPYRRSELLRKVRLMLDQPAEAAE